MWKIYIPALCVLLLLAIITGCNLTREPIIGAWTDSKYGEMTVVFNKDGTVTNDIDVEKIVTRIKQETPQQASMVRKYVEQMQQQARAIKLNWKKEGQLYSIRPTTPGKEADVIYARLEKDKLVPCYKDGKSNGGVVYTRK